MTEAALLETPTRAHITLPKQTLPWVATAPGVPYFHTEDGASWHPIGGNDSVSWRELTPLFRRKNVPAVESYVASLAAQGITCMRVMLEYAQVRHRYFEKAAGVPSRYMVQFWDDLFALCEKHGMRLLLTPFDTFWMWLHFKHHPYSRAKGGPLTHPSRTLLCRETREAIKARLTFAAERWGGSGALFAWDVWNEIHPAQAEMSAEPFLEFIEDLSTHLRAVETRKFGRAHPQTVSLFGPELKWRAAMRMEHAIFRHPSLDFANLHIYEQGTIDNPKNTVDAAVGMGRIVRSALEEITDGRPFFDSEHGPIHSFKDKKLTLPEAFDDEYFRHMQWAHLASGGAGGGMRWPNRRPHCLTAGMRRAQGAMARFTPLLDWQRFSRVNISEALRLRNEANKIIAAKQMARFGCASADQAVVYLLRRDTLSASGMLNRGAAPIAVTLALPGLTPGMYRITSWDTVHGTVVGSSMEPVSEGSETRIKPFVGDVALAFQRCA